MDPALLFLPLLAFAVVVLRLLRLDRRHRTKASRTMVTAGAVTGGIIAGILRLDNRLGITLTVGVVLCFLVVAFLAAWLAREPKAETKKPEAKLKKGPQNFIPEERHDYTKHD